jgi:hypothetical protein
MTPIFAPYGTAYSFRAPVVKTGSTNFAASTDTPLLWTPGAGDVKVIQNGTLLGNITTLPTYLGTQYTMNFSLSATEMATDEVIIQVVNRTYLTDQMFRIITTPQGALRSRLLGTGSTASSIVLDASASSLTDAYKGAVIAIIAGTGTGLNSVITGYNGTSKAAVISDTWGTLTDATSVYALYPQGVYGLTASQVESAVMDASSGIESGITFRQDLRLLSAMLLGKVSGAGTGTENFYAVGNPATLRVSVAATSTGNRTAVTLSP